MIEKLLCPCYKCSVVRAGEHINCPCVPSFEVKTVVDMVFIEDIGGFSFTDFSVRLEQFLKDKNLNPLKLKLEHSSNNCDEFPEINLCFELRGDVPKIQQYGYEFSDSITHLKLKEFRCYCSVNN